MHPAHFRKIVEDGLAAMGAPYDSPAAVELLLLTASQESQLYEFAWQHRGGKPAGPAVGPFQMEPGRWGDTMERMGDHLSSALTRATLDGGLGQPSWMAYNLRCATAMARAAYWLVKGPLPAADDIEGLDAYYQRGWCRGCKAQPGDAARAYRKFYPKEEAR